MGKQDSKLTDTVLLAFIIGSLIGGVLVYSFSFKQPSEDSSQVTKFHVQNIAIDSRLVLTQPQNTRHFYLRFDDCASAPGSISQILVSKTHDNYTRIADVNGGCLTYLDFNAPSDVHEFWVSKDQWYNLDQAIDNYPNNIVLHITEE